MRVLGGRGHLRKGLCQLGFELLNPHVLVRTCLDGSLALLLLLGRRIARLGGLLRLT